jgi:hypothetical protein
VHPDEKRSAALQHEGGAFSSVANCRNKGYFGTKVPSTNCYQLHALLKGWETQGGVMTTLQAMCLGAMLAWTPSLVVFAWLLREAPLDELQHDPS